MNQFFVSFLTLSLIGAWWCIHMWTTSTMKHRASLVAINIDTYLFWSLVKIWIWVKSRNCGCLVTWFCYQLIAKPGNKTATASWPDPYIVTCYSCWKYCRYDTCVNKMDNHWFRFTVRLWVRPQIITAHSRMVLLKHWGRDKMAAILRTTLSNAFSWMKMYELRLKFHWSLFLKVQSTIFQHRFR